MFDMGLVISTFIDGPRVKSGFGFELGIGMYTNEFACLLPSSWYKKACKYVGEKFICCLGNLKMWT